MPQPSCCWWALARLREHGGLNWDKTLDAYVRIAKKEPDKLARILQQGNAGRKMM